MSLGQLHVEYHQVPVAEGRAATGKVKLPHAAETLAQAFGDFLAMTAEAVEPLGQGVGIMQAQHFDIRRNHSALLHRA